MPAVGRLFARPSRTDDPERSPAAEPSSSVATVATGYAGPEISKALLKRRTQGTAPRSEWRPADPVGLRDQLEPVYAAEQISPRYLLAKAADTVGEEVSGLGVVAGIVFAADQILKAARAAAGSAANAIPELITEGFQNLGGMVSNTLRGEPTEALSGLGAVAASRDALDSIVDHLVRQVVAQVSAPFASHNVTLGANTTDVQLRQFATVLQPVADALRQTVPTTLQQGFQADSPLAAVLEKMLADKLDAQFADDSLLPELSKNAVAGIVKNAQQALASLQFTPEVYLLIGTVLTSAFFLRHLGAKLYRDAKNSKLDDVGVLAMEHRRLRSAQKKVIDDAPDHIRLPVQKIDRMITSKLRDVATADNSGGHIPRPSIAHEKRIWNVRNEVLLGRPTEKLMHFEWLTEAGQRALMLKAAGKLATFPAGVRDEMLRDVMVMAAFSVLPFEGSYNIDLRGQPGTGKDYFCDVVRDLFPDRFAEYSVQIERIGEGGPGGLTGANYSAIEASEPPTTRTVGLGLYVEAAFRSGWTNGILYNKETPWDDPKMQQQGKLIYDHSAPWLEVKAYETEYFKGHHINIFSSNKANFSGDVQDISKDDGGASSRMDSVHVMDDSSVAALESSKHKAVEKVRQFFVTNLPESGRPVFSVRETEQFDTYMADIWGYLKDKHPRAGIGSRVLFAGTLAAQIASFILVRKHFRSDEIASLGYRTLDEEPEAAADGLHHLTPGSLDILKGVVDRRYDQMIKAHEERIALREAS